ncbi:putative acyl-coenzyme A synthetase [Aspergillus lentulus]|uniref:Acyl-coenzyme A synthetase n=1 Tax=Aspergillus lentulus TaxID=293939 RepID=A0ABQ1AL63_ASPLE|nr:putative acyl-coenzyme A synthetase [Aspergillus lentulus]GFF31159.1 putative acyl-coenzyme A synthetase [Aspergillus lentulus]GFF82242.1 putative acyl-coenzyme A synthetase [Aspergillus lentulus]GFG06151.1 putative acyl-coenzyme A synthetase [Aspergillus lentulus]
MIFEPAERVLLPSVDVISYIFDNTYDANRPIYIDVNNPSRSISCAQARKIVRQLIAGLRAWGVKPGDCIAIHSFNDIHYCMLVLAIVGTGGIYTGTNPSYTTMELAHHFKAADVKFVISEPEILTSVLAAVKERGIPEGNLLIFDVLGQEVPAGHRSWKDLFNHGEEDWLAFNNLQRAKETTAARLFSSGTTGLPKAVTITHHNLIAQHELVFEVHPPPYQVSSVVAMPVFHVAAAIVTHFSAIKAGHTVYMMRRFDLETYLVANEKYQTTDLAVVPPMAIAILTSPFSRTRPFLHSIKNVNCGAAPLDKEVQTRFRTLLKEGTPFTQVWGMTETSAIATMFTYPEHDDTGSVGRLVPNVEAKLIDENGDNISAFGVRGELCVRGPIVTPGYFRNDSANAESFDAEGWFKTGDIAYCDGRTRKWYIVDRRKELIKVRGFQVAPAELEAVLLGHPLIVDAAVIGVVVPGADTEYPRAYVVRRPGGEGEKLTEEDVRKYLGERLARYKALTGGVKFVDAIAKTASGKILKRVLREDSKKDIEAGLWPKL